jgi:hypothetical protein
MTVAERDELLDAVERVEGELEVHDPLDPGVSLRPLLVALGDLVARAVRVWLVTERPTDAP